MQTKGATMRMTDMTEGSSLGHILRFAIPLFIGNIFQQIYSVVDTMVAGYNLGDHAIAAIGAISALYALIIDLAVGLNSGYGIVVTRCFGAHNDKEMKQAIAGMMMLNAAATLLLTALSLTFLRPMMRFMNTPEGIFGDAHIYIAIISGGMISTVAYNMFAAILRAVGNSRTPLFFLIISCALNIGLDILFVAGFKLGVAGAAIATVAAQTVSALLCGLYVFKNYRSMLPNREHFRIPKRLLTDVLSTGAAMALMLVVVDIGSVIFQRANNSLGESIISAHTAARRIIGIMMQPVGTIATATSTFVGQNWGAGKLARIRKAIKQAIGLEAVWSALACAAAYLFGSEIVRFTTGTSNAGIIENAVMSIRLHLTFFPALGILLCLRASMQAMGRKLAPVISSCLELGMKMLAALWLIPRLGFLGTSITEPITWTLMMAFLAIAFFARRERAAAADNRMEKLAWNKQ